MLWLALAVSALATSSSEAPRQTGAVAQAQATVRIVSGVQIRFDGSENLDAPPSSEGVVHVNGMPEAARLIEFQ